MSVESVVVSAVAEVNPRLPRELSGQSNRPVDFVPRANLSEEGRVTPDEPRELEAVVKGYTYFETGDVLVAKITPCMENGKAAYVRHLPNCIGFGSTEFHVLRPSAEVDGRYLFYMVWNPMFRQAAEGNMTGSAGQKRVPTKFFDRFKIPLPSLCSVMTFSCEVSTTIGSGTLSATRKVFLRKNLARPQCLTEVGQDIVQEMQPSSMADHTRSFRPGM